MDELKAYQTGPNNQEFKCPACGHVFEWTKMIARAACPSCKVQLLLKGYRGKEKKKKGA
jgi:DNA-directed RNA polymerase subunit RPC12/RpoP